MSGKNAKLQASLPKGDGNGLGSMASELVADPAQVRVGLVLFDVGSLETATDSGEVTAKVRLRRIEVITHTDDAAVMRRILMRAFERRTGQTTLPFDLEQDVETAFEGIDPEDAAAFMVQPTLPDPQGTFEATDDDLPHEGGTDQP
jgi:hypothetical protein